MDNIQALINSLKVSDFQAIVEGDEIQLIDSFIKEHAKKYILIDK